MKTLKYTSGWKYQVAETYFIQISIGGYTIHTDYIDLSDDGMLMIKKGYAWDGASGPAIDTKNFMRGSLVHDALYQLMRQGHLPQEWRASADDELRRICLEDGMSRIRAAWVHWAVRTFAKRPAQPTSLRAVLTAP